MASHRSAYSENRPWKSRSMGVHPSDVNKANEELKRQGVRGAYFDKDGHAVATSRQGRNGIMKATGKVDRDAGFGDYSGS